MSSIKKIKFKCPKCQGTKLWVQRKELIYQDIYPEVDLNEEPDIREMVHTEKDFVATSEATLICCQQCGRIIVPMSTDVESVDLAEELIDWLEEHNMLEDAE